MLWDPILKLNLHFFQVAGLMNSAHEPTKKTQLHWIAQNALSKLTLNKEKLDMIYLKTSLTIYPTLNYLVFTQFLIIKIQS